jgi:phosphohistidine phosphatase
MATKVVLIRHGKPQTGEGSNRTDPPLSTEGETATRKVALHLDKQGHKPDLILCSPLARAQQSAEIVAKVTPAPIQSVEALGGSFDQDALIAKLPSPSENKTVYMVGHDPTLTLFAHNLVGEKILPAGLSKSGSVVIEFNDTVALGKGRMVAYYHPDRIS